MERFLARRASPMLELSVLVLLVQFGPEMLTLIPKKSSLSSESSSSEILIVVLWKRPWNNGCGDAGVYIGEEEVYSGDIQAREST